MPGAGKQPVEVQEHIKELLEAGFDPTTIHRRLKVGRSSIYRMKRCLQQHGSAYMPVEMNKKNGRPKVLSAEQELEVREWLRDPKNRNRYLDDLVWLIHDRFGIVCSTTTMSKLKRKWIKVIEAEENGTPLDESTRLLVLETHPNLPVLTQAPAPPALMLQQSPATPQMQSQPQQPDSPQPDHPPQMQLQHQPHPPQQQMYPELPQQQHRQQPHVTYETMPQQVQASPYPQAPYPQAHHEPQIDARLLRQADPRLQSPYHYQMAQYTHQPSQQHIDSQLERQLQQEIASAGAARQ